MTGFPDLDAFMRVADKGTGYALAVVFFLGFWGMYRLRRDSERERREHLKARLEEKAVVVTALNDVAQTNRELATAIREAPPHRRRP